MISYLFPNRPPFYFHVFVSVTQCDSLELLAEAQVRAYLQGSGLTSVYTTEENVSLSPETQRLARPCEALLSLSNQSINTKDVL